MREEIPGLEIVRLTGTAAATSTVRRGAPATAWSQVQMNEILYCYNVKLYIIHNIEIVHVIVLVHRIYFRAKNAAKLALPSIVES